MGRDLDAGSRLRRQAATYLTDDNVPAEERGRHVAALLGHAYLAVLLMATETSWVVTTAVRIWRRRGDDLGPALKTGAHRPMLAILVASHLAYVVLRRTIRARLTREAVDYTARAYPASDSR